MAVQTSYDFVTRVALEGQIDSTSLLDLTSKSAEGTIPFGRAVVAGTNPDVQVILPSAATPAFYGVAARIVGLENPNPAPGERTEYEATETAAVLKSGYIWVVTEVAVAPGDDVYYRFTAGAGGTEIGRFRNDADTATAGLIAGATFETTAAADSVVKIRIPAYAQ